MQHFKTYSVTAGMQKWFYLSIITLIGFTGCNGNKNTPDVSNIKVNLEVQRFEQDFFTIDTNNISAAMPALLEKYPVFFPDFIEHILGLSLTDKFDKSDSAIKMFLRDYRLVEDTASKIFSNFIAIEDDVKKGLQFTKYYFPSYKTPEKLITFVGPLDAIFQTATGKTGDVITQDALAVGLQLHLGNDASLYQSQMAQSLFPKYVSRKFEPAYIAVNCMKNIIDDIYPPRAEDKTLLDLTIDKGKRLYVLDKLLPHVADTLKIGYTAAQLKGCYDNEGMIWSFLIQNNLIYNSDPLRIQSYVEEGPQTQELGDGSPGNISLFLGWQIIKKYIEKFPDTSIDALLQMDAKQILQDSKYKPR
ncbi:MAG TPA: hypothetical protein VFV68_13810 [Agriterribacter sp.]|nr:hypothetical protein [Agriterribacter sp.]